MENNVKVLKLITGEEVITRILEGDKELLTIQRPMIIKIITPDGGGPIGVQIYDWSEVGEIDKITLETKHILAIIDPKPTAEKQYLSVITGLTL